MQFEYYVLNYDFNKKKVIYYNIFNNINVQEYTEKEVGKYLRSPKKYKHIVQHKNDFLGREEIVVHGFDALVKEIDSIIRWEEWSRREFEVSIGDAFETDCEKLEKWDCYRQAKPNIKMIAREVLWQYKQYNKNIKQEKYEQI